MSFKNGMKLTNEGSNMLMRANGTGKTLNFTRLLIGDGEYSGDLSEAQALVSERMSLPIIGIKTSGNQSEVKTALSNKDLNDGFYFKEKALMALDPDTQAEKVYAYGYAGNGAEFIPDKDGAEIIERYENVLAIIDGAASVTAKIETGTFVTKDDFEGITDEHFRAEVPHFCEFEGRKYRYGLKPVIVGEVLTVAFVYEEAE